MGARVYVKGVESPFYVVEEPAEVLTKARECGLAEQTLPMVELHQSRGGIGDTPAHPVQLDPWSIVAVTEAVVGVVRREADA